ncbi:MAG: hypothetical protein ACLSAP_05810 [Oscillospiraceae bacterium]
MVPESERTGSPNHREASPSVTELSSFWIAALTSAAGNEAVLWYSGASLSLRCPRV